MGRNRGVRLESSRETNYSRVCRSLLSRARGCGRAAAVEAWLDDMIEIVDHPELDPLDKRARIDARRWIISKVAPGRSGDKIIVGGDGSLGGLGGAAVSPSELSDERLAALEALTALRLLADDEVPPPTPVEPPSDD